ncbi:hypothetical protein LAZ67_12003581 [Cordylochernes scorpioides]|uniref:Uncharacterized protein n=1 Tax=Cordylochernes scorpioides TaxID=51811 RepID=A0ABY6L2Y8_9ARAC|nr:hypothetical protein LAZ67_12003581 [Cordylochernes scorpioides]
MLCILWDQLGVAYYELLQPNERITGEALKIVLRFARAFSRDFSNLVQHLKHESETNIELVKDYDLGNKNI